MKIIVNGSGYVGLASGARLTELCNDVLCQDLDPRKIAMLRQDGMPIYQAGLEEIIKRIFAAGRQRFTTDVAEIVAHGFIQKTSRP